MRVMSFEHVIAKSPQLSDDRCPHLRIVVNGEYYLVAAQTPSFGQRDHGVPVDFLSSTAWQIEFESRAFSNFTRNTDKPAGLLDVTVDHAQSQSRALSGGLGREEGLKYAGKNLWRHPKTCI